MSFGQKVSKNLFVFKFQKVHFHNAFAIIAKKPPITPPTFQLIVGIYMVEIAVILSIFLNKVIYGEDIVGERSTIATTLVFATAIYFLSWTVVYSMFGGPIESLLSMGV